MSRKVITTKKKYIKKNELQRQNVNSNSPKYWGMKGYVHRLYMDRNPIINKSLIGESISREGKRDLDAIIKEVEKNENYILGLLSDAFGYGKSYSQGEKILLEIVSNTSNIMKAAYNIIYDEKIIGDYTRGKIKKTGILPELRDEIRKQLSDEAIKLFSDEDYDEVSKELAKNLQQLIEGSLSPNNIKEFKTKKMAVSQPAAVLGSLFERLIASGLQKKYIEALNSRSSDMANWIRNNAVRASVEAINFASYTGDLKATSSYAYRGMTERSYDILVKFNENDLLPIQAKMITEQDKKSINIVSNAKIENFINYANINNIGIDYLRFAIIHQHYFSNDEYSKKVKRAQKKNGYGGYNPSEATKATAIELLDVENTMSILKPAVNIMRCGVTYNFLRGVEEHPRPLFYLLGNIGGSGSLLRMSDILKAFKNGQYITMTSSGELDIQKAIDNYGGDKKGILNREEWYNKTNEAKALGKIKVTMSFNYGKSGNIKGGI